MWSWVGLSAAGILNGSFAVPMKTAKRWSFEHIWAVFSLLAMAVLPWLAVCVTIPEWRAVLGGVPAAGLARLVMLGLVWGVASLLYGLAVDALGVALGISIQLGLSIVAGAILPRLWANVPAAQAPAAFYAGLALMVAGVIVCASAGRDDGARGHPKDRSRFRRGLVIAVLGGLGAPLLNVGIQYGTNLLDGAGGNAAAGQWVAWALFLSAASISQSGYCFFRVSQRRGWSEYFVRAAAPEWLRILAMAMIWAASIGFYAISATALGPLGPSVGWPIFIGLIVVTSNAWGLALGEWRGRARGSVRLMLAGSVVLIAATFLVAQGQ
jgi:L-rhamnose-H+ transport protein